MCISLRPSTLVMGSNVTLGSFGVTGSKGHFHSKCYNSLMLYSMTIRLIHVHQLETSYLCFGVQCQSGVILGSLGSKAHFYYKCYNMSMLHSMTITLIHVHQLETLYLRYGVKCKYGVIWGHWGQKVIFTKNAITRPCYMA